MVRALVPQARDCGGGGNKCPSLLYPPLCVSLPPELTDSPGEQSYLTKAEYTAQLEDEVSFPKHVMVDVIEKSITGWWTIR